MRTSIGMSGLLVKSTVVMRDNLAELNSRGLARTWPVLLGGAALTRAYVEQDLAGLFDGEVRYARDAFEGLRLMDAFMAVKRGDAGAQLPPLREARVKPGARLRLTEPAEMPARSDVATDNEVPVPPFYGDRIVKGIALAEYAAFLDERATFLGQWGLKPARGGLRALLRGAGGGRGPPPAADVAGPDPGGGPGRGRGGLRVLPGRQ